MSNSSSHDSHQARAALEQADRVGLATDRDRRVHGLATAVFGAVMGIYVVAHRLIEGDGWAQTGLFGAYVVTLTGLATWQRHAANTAPRGSRQIGWVGLAGSVVIMVASVIWMNVRQGDNRIAGIGDQPDHWWVHATVGVATALPSLIAGHVIFYGRRP